MAPSSHTIRLAGPWQFERWTAGHCTVPGNVGEVADRDSVPPPISDADRASQGTVRLPATWRSLAPGGFAGTIRLVRRFGKPTGLESARRVLLAVAARPAPSRVLLNGRPLSGGMTADDEIAWIVTGLLASRNELAVEMTVDAQTAAPPAAEEPNFRGARLVIVP